MDPLVCVRRFRDAREREIVGLLASSLAYGRVEQIIKSIESVLRLVANDPLAAVSHLSYSEKKKALRNFRHRFNSGDDIALLLESIRGILSDYGSLEALFLKGWKRDEFTMKECVCGFVKGIRDYAKRIHPAASSFDFLLPSPDSGSACKRLNMYFRWMVRPDDGIDLGVWKRVLPSFLVMPVDAHVMRIARYGKLTERKSADWKTVEEITGRLREIDSSDPVKYDFSLCRYGMIIFRKGSSNG